LHEERQDISLEQLTNEGYFGLIRNFQRIGWIILYLFGASPAICKNFFKTRPALMDKFEEFDNGTLFHPYATSLRMSDIGYKSKNQASLNIDYNSLEGYVSSLGQAIATPYPEYEQIGVKVGGEYRQLNSNILQIENEFYSIIRPKQIAESGEKPTLALKRRGVRYVEMRSLDLDVFEPIGINPNTARFIEALLLTCLLNDSPPISQADHHINNANQLAVANFGRKPGLELVRDNHKITLTAWAGDVFAAMQPVCEILDQDQNGNPYSAALAAQYELLANPDLTPSARVLANMRLSGQPFSKFAQTMSAQHAKGLSADPLDEVARKLFVDMAKESQSKQQQLESKPQIPFDDFLQHYFAQH